ncbi:MAG: DegV family EDD domain-containing protein [Lachnospiraceae bacterium]|nr:DegV family EDD domain-containing protein [Lachnospiraceae bacterium]
MLNKIKQFMHSLIGGELGLEERISRTVLLLAFIGSVIGMGRVGLGVTPVVLFALVPMCIVAGIALYMSVKQGQTKIASWLLILIYNVVLFPIVFVMSGGIHSGTPVWFVLGLVYIFLLFKGKELIAALVVSFGAFLATYIVTYLYPEILMEVSREYGYVDSYVTLLNVSIFVGILMKIQQITYDKERRLAEQQKDEIEQIARSKDTFFANMSHEIRTPINTIIGLNEMTLRENISDEVAENAINIQNASKMLLTTINDILDLSKLESGKMEIVPAQYEVSSMFSDLVNLIWIRAHQKELEFKVDIDHELPAMLYGDEVRIKQVVANMLTNAVKYTEKGSVTLSANAERIAPDEIILRISVADTGKGIRKEDLEDLFSSFKRVDETSNRKIEGTGLGLNISKQLMEMMGGKLTVDSVYHKGSVFTMEVKQRIINVEPIGVINFGAQKQLDYRARYKQSFTAPDAKILVVDDNEMNRMVVTKLLRGTGMKIDTAESGKECLKRTAESAYHVILMDHMMPKMDGEETMRAVRSQAKGFCQKVPIIALTANVMTNAEQVYQNMGFDGYLAKPINSALLEAGLLKCLPHDLVEYTADKEKEDQIENAVNQITGVKKRKIAITADCICDLPKELLEKFQIRLMYCYVHTKEGRFSDLFEVSSDSILDYLQTEGNYAHSSTAEPAEYEYFFADVLQTAEQVIHITATTDLSGAYPNALQASKSFDNVTVFDSGHISSGHGLMVLRAAVLAEEEQSVEAICNDLDKFKDAVCSNFFVPSTESLFRNGKVSGAVHKFCLGLNLHPVLHIAQNELKLWQIKMGNTKRAQRKYVKKLLSHNRQMDKRLLFLTYAGCTVSQLEEIMEEVEKYAHFDNVIMQKASATVSSNCGMGVFGLMYVKKYVS